MKTISIIVIALFVLMSASCASSSYCKSWNNPASNNLELDSSQM